MKKIGLTIIAILVLSTANAGGPWVQKKGIGYFKLSEWWIVFDGHYTDAGNVDPNVTTGIFNTSIYAEYGLTDRFTGTLYFPFLSRTYMNNQVSATTGALISEGDAINTLGDADLGIKYSITKPGARFPLAASLVLGLPLGTTDGGRMNNLQTGDGEFNQMLQLDFGTGFNLTNKINAYTSVYSAFNNRTNDFSDEYRYGIEAGLGFFNRRLWLIGRLNGVESLKNGATAETVTSTSIFANNTEFTSWAFEVAYYFGKRWGASYSYASAFRGEIIAARPSHSFGIFYDMSR